MARHPSQTIQDFQTMTGFPAPRILLTLPVVNDLTWAGEEVFPSPQGDHLYYQGVEIVLWTDQTVLPRG